MSSPPKPAPQLAAPSNPLSTTQFGAQPHHNRAASLAFLMTLEAGLTSPRPQGSPKVMPRGLAPNAPPSPDKKPLRPQQTYFGPVCATAHPPAPRERSDSNDSDTSSAAEEEHASLVQHHAYGQPVPQPQPTGQPSDPARTAGQPVHVAAPARRISRVRSVTLDSR